MKNIKDLAKVTIHDFAVLIGEHYKKKFPEIDYKITETEIEEGVVE